MLGGSTNAVLHFLAIASAANVSFTLDDFQEFNTTPLFSRFKTKWKISNGGSPSCWWCSCCFKVHVGKCWNANGDCLTVTGKTLAENLASVPDLSEGQDVILPIRKPIKILDIYVY